MNSSSALYFIEILKPYSREAVYGFSAPKRTSRPSPPHSPSPRLNSARWFNPSVLTVEEPAEEPVHSRDGPLIDWSTSTDEDGVGDIPVMWIKQEGWSLDMNWSLPEDENKFSSGNIFIHRRDGNTKAKDTHRIPEAASQTTIHNGVHNPLANSTANPAGFPIRENPRILAAWRYRGGRGIRLLLIFGV
ncbi:hypothetical protein B0H14DRAFT_2631716 [Mycena olivaceomarginata]|nr:hypothetical protein B0H14DRAFT_2631716 [Mycena olivaceomarginata]